MATIASPVKVTGLDKIDTSKTHVYAVTHASALDIPVLYANLPFQFRIVFKKELLSYPLIGGHLKRSGQVCINQQNPTRSIADIRSAVKSLRAGMPLVIFPEGGRTPDGEIKPFLPGAFYLAIKAQVDIVPVALIGTFELLPMNTYHIKSRPLEMRVGQPISTAGYGPREMEQLSAKGQESHGRVALLLTFLLLTDNFRAVVHNLRPEVFMKFFYLLLVLCFAVSMEAQSASRPTVAEAEKFMSQAEARLNEMNTKAARAGWVQENFITDDTEARGGRCQRPGHGVGYGIGGASEAVRRPATAARPGQEVLAAEIGSDRSRAQGSCAAQRNDADRIVARR